MISMALSSLSSKKSTVPIKALYFLISFYRGIGTSDAFLCTNGVSQLCAGDTFEYLPTSREELPYLSRDLRYYQHGVNQRRSFTLSSLALEMGKPKRGSIVDSYQTVSVNCAKCKTRLFRYKKKNGTKSNLIKCYIERISEDCVDLVRHKQEEKESDDIASSPNNTDWICPNCKSKFGRDSMIHGRPAIKLAGRKTQMTKK